MYKYEYKDNKERENLLETNKDKTLIREENVTEGNFLVFSNEPIMITIPKTEYENLQNQLLLSENQNVEGGIF